MEMMTQYALLLLLVVLLLVRVFFGPTLKRRLTDTSTDRDENLTLKSIPVHVPVSEHRDSV